MNTVRLAIFGGGRRVQIFYAELCHWLQAQQSCKCVAICNRSPEKVDHFAKQLGANVYSTPNQLLESERIDAAIVSVSPDYKDRLAQQLAEKGLHLFLDSPVPSWRTGKILEKLEKTQNLKIEIAEDQSFSPEAEFQRNLLASGLFGKLLVVHNQGKEIDYHGLARLHNLVGSFVEIQGVSGRNLSIPGGDRCYLRELEFSKLLYLSQYTSPKNHSLRLEKDFRLVCEYGVIGQTHVLHREFGFIPFQKHPLDDDGSPQGKLRELSISINQNKFVWNAETLPMKWSRQHHGLHLLMRQWLQSINSEDQTLLYGLTKALKDRHILLMWAVASRLQLKLRPNWFPFLHNLS